METMRVKALNVELGILKKQVDKVNQMFNQENWQYNVLESQFESIKARNAEWVSKNEAAEKKLNDSLQAADSIIKMAEENARQVKASAHALYVKASAKFKEVEEKIEKSERNAINKHLKEMELVA